jgi:hypothetical protein
LSSNREISFDLNQGGSASAVGDFGMPKEDNEVVRLDARGLEPPMPMVHALEALERLPSGNTLLLHTDRRPAFLLDELPRRGFVGESEAAPDGAGYVTRIQHA